MVNLEGLGIVAVYINLTVGPVYIWYYLTDFFG